MSRNLFENAFSPIQSWDNAFRGSQTLDGVRLVYDDLIGKGIAFPINDLDAMTLTHQ